MTMHRAGSLVFIIVLGVLLGWSSVPQLLSQEQQLRCFEETGYCIDGRIRDYWEQNGGLPVFGLPISPQRTFTIEGQPIEAQWFERNRLELHPQNAPPYDVLLGRLGVDVLAQQGRDWQAFPMDEAAQPGCRYFAETQQNVCGDILTAWQANGLELGDPSVSERESLALFGLPISPLQAEEIEGETYQVQWFERARFELHPENEPRFNVLLGLLGNEIQSTPSSPTTTPAPEPEPTAAPRPDPGTLGGYLAFHRRSGEESNIFTIQADGTQLRQLTTDGTSTRPRWSPDGRHLVYTSSRDGNAEIYRMDADGSNQTRLTTDPSVDQGPVWSPTGDQIAFLASRVSDMGNALFVMQADGTEETRLSPFADSTVGQIAWAPDGRHLAFLLSSSSATPPEPEGIYTIAVDGSNLQWRGAGFFPIWSPDGARLTFSVRTSEARGIQTIDVATGEIVGLIDVGFNDPVWSPDSERIAFPSTLDASRDLPFPENDIYTAHPDGTGLLRLTDGGFNRLRPTWSPEGARLAFVQNQANTPVGFSIGLVNSDGSGLTILTEGDVPVWQPSSAE